MGSELTHASFFSGVGGLDLGLERAGWRTVSFSEIDPYANAVLAERWPGVPNLGDIQSLAQRSKGNGSTHADGIGLPRSSSDATLWSGGFPCQDLSVAGKRAGFGGARSSLAFAFLDLVERHRPPAVLLENVPGLLSSHRGRDMARLVGELAELGYGWAYRILDARHFGVPQRRRRVFIVALDLERGLTAERAAEVLSVGTRCDRHPATGHATGEGAAPRPGNGISHALSASHTRSGRYDPNGETYAVSPPPDSGGVRAPDGLAGRVDGLNLIQGGEASYHQRDRVYGHTAPALDSYGDSIGDPPIVAYRKSARVNADPESPETWVDDGLANTLNAFDTGDIRSTHIALGHGPQDDPLLPLGLDSHRYRCCGNGVVSSVAEWVGLRLATVFGGG